MPPPYPVLTQRGSRPLAMRGASAVAAVPGVMYLAEDDEGIYRRASGRLRLWADAEAHPALADLEGLATDVDGTFVWALAEESGEVVRVFERKREIIVEPLGHLERPGDRRNKGFEGLAYLPAAQSPNGAESLVAVHEDKPRRIVVFRLDDLAETHAFTLPDEAKEALTDLADVTVDPVSGALLLLSEETRRIGVCAIDGDALVLVSLTDVRVTDAERPEGLDFVTPAQLVVVSEGPAVLMEFRVTRPVR